ncbi:MAG: prepilin-type N-terminal cleavage/methylation domain-containing protein [Cytophagales bacterium]|nr:prepilin-type N-terminal cleavage/methylation domain-containing protein [Armatimonadota bacterium]
MRIQKAFSLIELLMVLAIISLLAALIFPALSKSRADARRTACVPAIHQVWQSLRMYADDSDGAWPGNAAWIEWSSTHPSVPWCPDMVPRRAEIARDRRGIRGVPGYAYNTAYLGIIVNNKVGDRPVQDSDVAFPSVTVVLSEQAPNQTVAYGPDPFNELSPYPYGQEEGWVRHNGGANYAFHDGHVKWYLPQTVSYNRYPPGNDGRSPTFALLSPEQVLRAANK